jgi:tRNA nucleotidyltransferase (CCA-adding enzyme)
MLDFFGGQRDLKDRQIRVLHALSFVEDPTRAFRALRFEQRFHFRIGKFTERLLHTAARHLDAVSGPRILNELVLILEEPQVAAVLRRLDAHGLLAALASGLVFDDAAERRFSRVAEVMGWFRLLYTEERIVTWLPAWLSLTAQLDEESLARLGTRIDIRGEVADKMISSRRGVRDALRALAPLGSGETLAPSAIGNTLRALPVEGVLWLMITADTEAIRKAASRFLTEWRHLKPELSGSDIVALGIPQGPRVGETLRALRDAKLDGRVGTREQEVTHVRALLGSDKFR